MWKPERKRLRLCEASRAPSCSNVVINEDDIAKGSVRELVGRVRNVVLMNVYLDLENPGGSGFWVGGYMSQVRETGKLVYEQPGNEVDGSSHGKEGSK